MKYTHFTNLNYCNFILLLFLLLTIFLRFPSLFEPLWYDDEAITLAVGHQLSKEDTLYKDVIDHKPPIIYWLASFSSNLFIYKLIGLIWVLITTIFFYLLSKSIITKIISDRFQAKIAILLSLLIFTLTLNTPKIEGTMVNGEILMIGPLIIAWWLYWRFEKTSNKLWLFGMGMLGGIAMMIKIPSVTDVVVYIFLLLNNLKSASIQSILPRLVSPILGGFVIVAFIFIWAIYQNNLYEFIIYALSFNFNYINAWGATKDVNQLDIISLELIFRTLLATFISLLIFYTNIQKEIKYLFVWFVWSVWGALLSERPYPHYLIQIIPSTSILLGIVFFTKIKYQLVIIIFMLGLLIIQDRIEFWRYPVKEYYLHFYNNFTYISSQVWNRSSYLYYPNINVTNTNLNPEFLNFYDPNTYSQYELANYIKLYTDSNDNIFIFGGKPGAYVLSSRTPASKFITDFHIKDFDEFQNTQSELIANLPKLIIIGHHTVNWDWLNNWLLENYQFTTQIGQFQIWQSKY